jgi:hypothetical protein
LRPYTRNKTFSRVYVVLQLLCIYNLCYM